MEQPSTTATSPTPSAQSRQENGFVKGTGYGGDPAADAAAAQNAAQRQDALAAATHEDSLKTVAALDAICKACTIQDSCLPVRCARSPACLDRCSHFWGHRLLLSSEVVPVWAPASAQVGTKSRCHIMLFQGPDCLQR